MGGIVGIKGGIKALEYDASLSTPIIYPGNLDVDNYTLNFYLSYQL